MTEAMATLPHKSSIDTGVFVVDTDVHHGPQNPRRDLLPYLQERYRERFSEYGPGGGNGNPYAMNGGQRATRGDLLGGPADRGAGAVTWDPSTTRRQLLEGYSIDIAILTGGELAYGGVPSTPDLDYGSAIATAVNRWTQEHWLEYDQRFKAAANVNSSDPEAAALEIDRAAQHPGVCAVLLGTGSEKPFGHRRYRPIHEAAARNGLPIAMHLGGMRNRPTASGYPTYYIESRFYRPQLYAIHISSFIFEGVFERYPDLKLCSIESGINWVPDYLWRADTNWRQLRNDLPWVKRPPSEYVREHVRFSSQPLDVPGTTEGLKPILNWMYAERTLMFSSDYPHFDFDDPHELHKRLDPSMRDRVMSKNALETYRI